MVACVTVSASRLIKKYPCSCPLNCESSSFPFCSVRSKYGEIISAQLLRANIPNAVELRLFWVFELHILTDDKVLNIFQQMFVIWIVMPYSLPHGFPVSTGRGSVWMRRAGEPSRGNRAPCVPGISRDGHTGCGQQCRWWGLLRSSLLHWSGYQMLQKDQQRSPNCRLSTGMPAVQPGGQITRGPGCEFCVGSQVMGGEGGDCWGRIACRTSRGSS